MKACRTYPRLEPRRLAHPHGRPRRRPRGDGSGRCSHSWRLAFWWTLVVAIVGGFGRAAKPPPAPVYSSQQVADAKAKVCAEYSKVHNAITRTLRVIGVATQRPNKYSD